MNVEIVTVFMGIIAGGILAAVPWGYSVHGRLARIEQDLHRLLDLKDEFDELRNRVHAVEVHCAEVCQKVLDQG